MTKSAAEVEREVEASRGRLNRTAEALKHRMTPGELFEEATATFGSAGQAVLSKLTEQARQNPLPMAMIGLGAAWLLFNAGRTTSPSASSSRAARHRYRHPEYDTGYGEADPSESGGIRETVSGLAASAQDAYGRVRETGSSVLERSGQAWRDSTNRVSEYRHRVQESFTDTMEQEPLLMAGMGALVGLAIGSALPSTETEDRLMGSMRDRVLEKGEQVAEEGLRQARDVAGEAYAAAKSELQGEDGDMAAGVQNAARAGVSVVRDRLPS